MKKDTLEYGTGQELSIGKKAKMTEVLHLGLWCR